MQSYTHPETQDEIYNYKEIAKNYVFRGWFLIDVVAVFPFETFMSQGKLAKLLRLFRLPRLFKLFSMQRFKKLMKSLAKNSQEEKIQLMTQIEYTYKIFRLIIVAVTVTYFIGCFWYLISKLNMEE